MPQRSQTNEGVGEKFYLVDSQAERVQFGQMAKVRGEARQAVVTQVQNLQVPQLTDDGRELRKLGEKHTKQVRIATPLSAGSGGDGRQPSAVLT